MLQKVDGATSTEGFLVSASAASSVTIIKLMRWQDHNGETTSYAPMCN